MIAFKPRSYQREVLELLEKYPNVIVVRHRSSGRSWFYANAYLKRMENVTSLTPTNPDR